MADELLIRAEHLSRHYGPHQAVSDLSFSLATGDILGFLGPNGAGKSTTMKMLTGNLAPSEGEIYIGGHNIQSHPLQAKARLGYLPETPPLYLDLTVTEQLRFAGALHQLNRSTQKQRLHYVMDVCQLSSVRHRLIAQLSKGFKQRVGLAQALISNPDVLILDEPTSGLDPLQIIEIRALIQNLAQEHAVLLSTHILSEVQSLCNRVLIIHQGMQVFESQIEDLMGDQQATQTRVKFIQPPDLNAITTLDGVSGVQPLADGYYQLDHQPGWAAEQLTTLSTSNGFPIVEMTPSKPSLEQLFIQLTCNDPSVTEAV